MSDIVEWLRQTTQEKETSNRVKTMCADAADEIERLRATIEHLRSVSGAVSHEAKTFGQIKAGSMTPIDTGGRPIAEVVDPYGVRKTPE